MAAPGPRFERVVRPAPTLTASHSAPRAAPAAPADVHRGHAHEHPLPAAPAPAPALAPAPAGRLSKAMLPLVVLAFAGSIALAWFGGDTAFLGLPLAALGLAAVAGSADLIGAYFTVSHRRVKDARYLIAFSSGLVVAAAFFELMPHAFEEAIAGGVSAETVALTMAAGFFLFYLVEKLVMLHACGERECESHTVGPVVVAGMALDNVVDGVGIAVGFAVDPALGVIITLAVLAHEVPQGITSAELLARAGHSQGRILALLAVAGLAYVVGALISGFLPEVWHQRALAFVAGSFLYVGGSDLLAEAHKRFNIGVVGCVLAGAAIMYGLTFIERMSGGG